MRSTRAFSLLEMLIVLALLAALSALVLPALGGRLASATASGSAKSLLGAAMAARARAVATGEAVALVGVVPQSGGPRLYSDTVAVPDAEAPAQSIALELTESAELLLELPRDTRVQLEPPVAPDGTEDETEAPDVEEQGAGVVRLALFLPDGSAVRPAPLFLVVRGTALFRCDLGVSTGRASLTAVQPVAPQAETEEAEPPPAPEPPGGDTL